MMSSQNSMSKIEFVIEHVFWSVIAMVWYKNLFRCLGQYSIIESRLILCGLIIVFSVVGGFLEFRQRRNGFSVFLNLVAGFGSYMILTYIQIRRGLITGTLIVSIVVSIICIVYIMSRKIVHRRKIKRIIRQRIGNAVYVTQTIFGFGLAFIICALGLNIFFGSSIMSARISPASYTNIAEQTIANNMETISLLKEDSWCGLTVQEKLDVLQVVANIEQEYLGLPYILNVGTANLQGDTLGYYNDATRQIIVSVDHLLNGSPFDILTSLLHEVFHSFEYRCCDAWNDTDVELQSLMLYRNARTYAEEFENYIDGDTDFYSYYWQQCEVDSREYAESRIKDYYKKINEYFGENIMDITDEESTGCQVVYTVEYGDDGNAYLLNKFGERISGPYQYIENELNWVWDKACRYIGLNGLIGYLDTDGNKITPPIFIEASELTDGVALVSEKEGSVYYIDTEGNKISKDYLDGYPFEHQGCFARVLLDDGKWGIINRHDEVVFSGADFIEELPTVTVLGSAIVDGHAVLFQLDYGAEEEFRIVEEYEQFEDISYVYMGEFAIVKNRFDMYGVVDWNGELIISDSYKSISFEVIEVEDNYYGEYILFKLQKDDGTYTIMRKKI